MTSEKRDNELIKRQDVIDAIARTAREKFDLSDEFEHYISGLVDVENAIRKLPSADLERKKGKWLSQYDYCEKHAYNPSGLAAFWWCDQCEQAVEHPTNFCPNCGADMRGEQDD